MEKRDDFYLPEEVIEWMGLKKSEYLSKLIELQADFDYGFEDYARYDHLLPQTLEAPDKMFEDSSEEYKIQVYLRTYRDQETFHQLVIGTVCDDKESKSSVFVPILSFVTKMDELAKQFCIGELKQRPTLN